MARVGCRVTKFTKAMSSARLIPAQDALIKQPLIGQARFRSRSELRNFGMLCIHVFYSCDIHVLLPRKKLGNR
jgi:hypothetical protein